MIESRLTLVAAVAVAAVALALGLAQIGGRSTALKRSPRPIVASIPHGTTPAAAARGLSRWLRSHSR